MSPNCEKTTSQSGLMVILGIKSHSQCSVANSSTLSIFLNHGAWCFMLYKISCSFESGTYSTPVQVLAASLVCRAGGHLFQPQLLLGHLTWNGRGPNSCGQNSIAPWVQPIMVCTSAFFPMAWDTVQPTCAHAGSLEIQGNSCSDFNREGKGSLSVLQDRNHKEDSSS